MWPCKCLHWADSAVSLTSYKTAFKCWFRGTESCYYLKPRNGLRHSHILITSCQSTSRRGFLNRHAFSLPLVYFFILWFLASQSIGIGNWSLKTFCSLNAKTPACMAEPGWHKLFVSQRTSVALRWNTCVFRKSANLNRWKKKFNVHSCAVLKFHCAFWKGFMVRQSWNMLNL